MLEENFLLRLNMEINFEQKTFVGLPGQEQQRMVKSKSSPATYMSIRVSHFGVIFPNHSASGRDLCASYIKIGTFGKSDRFRTKKKWHFEWPNQNSKTTFIVHAEIFFVTSYNPMA